MRIETDRLKKIVKTDLKNLVEVKSRLYIW
jgi:hypothetical protein